MSSSQHTLTREGRGHGLLALLLLLVTALCLAGLARTVQAETDCPDVDSWPTYKADVSILDTAMVFNRLGAQNPNWMIYALTRDLVVLRDVVDVGGDVTIAADTSLANLSPGQIAGLAGNVVMRPDKRPRPLLLRLPRCSKLEVNFTNLLNAGFRPTTPAGGANPVENLADLEEVLEDQGLENVNNNELGFPIVHIVDDQVKTRFAGLHVTGLQLAIDIGDDASNVGMNLNASNCTGAAVEGSTVAPRGTCIYTLLAENEGAFKISNPAAAIGGEATGGNNGLGAFGVVAVQPKGAQIYRSQVYEEEFRLASDLADGTLDGTYSSLTANGQPVIDYDARYPTLDPWMSEGKAGLPILRVIDPVSKKIVHSEINAIVAGSEADGTFHKSTYPLESVDLRNPTVPNRLEPFRDWASIFHDEAAALNAFEAFFAHPVLGHTLHGVRDAFMINYGSGGIGSEIIANRLGVGPMYDCLGCAYEEFFLTSFTVGDPSMRVDVPANFGLENVTPEAVAAQDPALVPLIGPKATTALFQDDPGNIHNSYTGDFAKFRNIHAGPKEQHVFHLHNHQWLFNANDDRSNYLDAQGVGPGSSYTYEINFGGSGNRNKTAGDAIFHCHFYPHFAQGMWYHWRIHDVTETGTILAASVEGGPGSNRYHDAPFELGNSQPALASATNAAGLTNIDLTDLPANARNRAHPDGEILAGIPITAIVPMPGKPMAPMPGDVVVVTKDSDGDGAPDSSQNFVVERDVNPGFPFWVAGTDCSNGVNGVFDPACSKALVGQRPTTPPLDMITVAEATTALANEYSPANVDLPDGVTREEYETAFKNAAGGFDGGLPRHALDGCKGSAGNDGMGNALVPGCPHVPALVPEIANLFASAETRLDFHKEVLKAKGIFFPEAGTDLERLAMKAHGQREHATSTILPNGTVVDDGGMNDVKFVLNGLPPIPGAPYQDPCVSDTGQALESGGSYNFFDAEGFFKGPITAGRAWDKPFTYAAANIQIDAVFNKVGYHYPQQRIIALWNDVLPTINKEKAPEPFVMRLNTFNCAKYQHSNLVPKEFEVDDYQVRTPTDIIGQHIHLPKWDLTTADGAANGWNYEDGTLSPGMVVERIHAINAFNNDHALAPEPHPVLGKGVGNDCNDATNPAEWCGSRVTLQRWFADPVVDRDGVDRGLGIVFTHDHYGPSTHQQIGLYSTLLAEPAESTWVHNETGVQLGTRQTGCGDPNAGCDGGPTSWQAAILPGGWSAAQGTEAFREFYFEFSDFQHAYEAGVYVGAGPDGRPDPDGGIHPEHNALGINVNYPVTANSFRHAINPSVRQEANCKGDLANNNCPDVTVSGDPSPFPDIARYPAVCDDVGTPRPCPEAITADDGGMLVVNYRNEPVGLRVFDPFKLGPDNHPGTQADGLAGDLAFALATKLVDEDGTVIPDASVDAEGFINRAIPQLNVQPAAGDALAVGQAGFYVPNECPGCTIIATAFPPPINAGGPLSHDPFTPMMRTFPGDVVKVKIQAGGHEHEHNATIHGLKWVQGNSGHGPDRPASGWRNGQNAGISEQFNLSMPVISDRQALPGGELRQDYAYTIDASQDGWWSGTWGLLTLHREDNGDFAPGEVLPNAGGGPLVVLDQTDMPAAGNRRNFAGVCPREGPRNRDPILNLREYTVVAVAANDVLNNPGGATITGGLPDAADVLVEGGPLDPAGGTLVANPRPTLIPGNTIGQPRDRHGPLHDPTGLMFVLAEDLEPVDPFLRECGGRRNRPGNDVLNPNCPVKLKDDAPVEPLVLRAKANDCIEVTLHNRVVRDVDGDGVVDPVADLAGFNTLLQMVTRDRQAEPDPGEPANSMTTFNNNLIVSSSHVGLHAQMVEYDMSQHDGVNVGINNVSTVAPPRMENGELEAGEPITYRWYAGDLRLNAAGDIAATGIESGGSNLTPADKIKQTQKGMIGGLVIEPDDASWTTAEQVPDRQGGGGMRGTRADAVVTHNGTEVFHDLVAMKQSGLNHRFKDGEAIPNIASEGQGIPEDSHDAGQKGINYASEPAWFRFALQPDANFGNAGAGPETLGGVDGEQMFSNALVVGDPWTPVFTATAGQQVRMRMLNPAGVGRGSTLDLHGHIWARDPYLPEDPLCLLAPSLAGCGLSSVEIGDNPLAWYINAQESWAPMDHFDLVMQAGGLKAVDGDYLFRDHASFGVTDGVWGLMRVEPAE